MEIFTPNALPHAPSLRWWLSEEYTQPEFNGADLIMCPHCGEYQKLEWFWAFTTSLIDCELIEERCKLYAAIERAENQLMDLHECKVVPTINIHVVKIYILISVGILRRLPVRPGSGLSGGVLAID